MTGDLVERLRRVRLYHRPEREPAYVSEPNEALVHLAADEIERLRAALAEREAEVAGLREVLAPFAAEVKNRRKGNALSAFGFGDCERAAAALASPTPAQGVTITEEMVQRAVKAANEARVQNCYCTKPMVRAALTAALSPSPQEDANRG